MTDPTVCPAPGGHRYNAAGRCEWCDWRGAWVAFERATDRQTERLFQAGWNACEREVTQLLQEGLKMAIWHMDDRDECGDLARDFYKAASAKLTQREEPNE